MPPRLSIDPEVLARFCQRHGIRRLSLFGSRLHGAARPGRDVDRLGEFDSSARPTLFDMADMTDERSLLVGAEVDLRDPRRS